MDERHTVTAGLGSTATVGPRPLSSGIDADRCSIAGTLEALGDVWSILVLRELFFGVRRFNEMQADLQISRSVLTDRLNRLVELGVVRTVPYQEPRARSRNEYRLTRKGVELLPVMVALMTWGDSHVNGGDGPVELRDRVTGEAVRLELRSTGGRPVAANEMEPRVVG
jgi:DNA-binding HxlR family transcriptional regulator